MNLKLFELVGTDTSRPFSPYCWRARLALAHKGLSADSIPWCFTEKGAIAPHGSEKVPVLLDDDKAVAEGRYDLLTERARRLVAAVRAARSGVLA